MEKAAAAWLVFRARIGPPIGSVSENGPAGGLPPRCAVCYNRLSRLIVARNVTHRRRQAIAGAHQSGGRRSGAFEMDEKLQNYQDAYHEGTEERGILTLIVIILGLIGIGVLIYSLTWALAPNLS